jgi:hypothetical protein
MVQITCKKSKTLIHFDHFARCPKSLSLLAETIGTGFSLLLFFAESLIAEDFKLMTLMRWWK